MSQVANEAVEVTLTLHLITTRWRHLLILHSVSLLPVDPFICLHRDYYIRDLTGVMIIKRVEIRSEIG